MSTEKQTMVHKVTLGSGKVVLIRDPKIKDQNMAVQAAGQGGSDNNMVFATRMQQELMKMLIVQINGKEIPKSELEDLDEHFTFAEFGQLSQFIGALMGNDDMGKSQSELVAIG